METMKPRIIITGASGAMGAAATEALAAQGRPVLMAVRNPAKAAAVRDAILARVPQADLEIAELDLASQASVRLFASGIAPGSVAALFNNAGVISRQYQKTEEGFENTFAVNYFGPWLLTQLLLPKLAPGTPIVNMVSLTCKLVDVDVASLRPGPADFSQLRTYARSKRALLSFTLELARRHPELVVNMADPGIVASNMIDLGHWYDPLADLLFKPFCKRPEQGVQPALRALAATAGPRYYVAQKNREIPRCFLDASLDARLWEATASLTGVSA